MERKKYFYFAAATAAILSSLIAFPFGGQATAIEYWDSILMQGGSNEGNSINNTSANATDPVEFRLAMRELWTDHVVWTRQYIVDSVAELPSTHDTANRLLKNQEDIGNATKPYYGEEAGNELTGLLKEHILIAVDLVDAAGNRW